MLSWEPATGRCSMYLGDLAQESTITALPTGIAGQGATCSRSRGGALCTLQGCSEYCGLFSSITEYSATAENPRRLCWYNNTPPREYTKRENAKLSPQVVPRTPTFFNLESNLVWKEEECHGSTGKKGLHWPAGKGLPITFDKPQASKYFH